VLTSRYEITGGAKDKSGADVEVRYMTLGVVASGTIECRPGVEVVHYRLHRSGGSWRITGPQTYPHISRQTAKRTLGLAMACEAGPTHGSEKRR